MLQSKLNKSVKHYRRLIQDGPGNLEVILEKQMDRLDDTRIRLEEIADSVEHLEKISNESLRGIGVLRFNPFEDIGGDQSFCIAVLDGQMNGFVITSIFTRAQSRVYAKAIENGTSSYQLSKEEQEAVNLAKKGKRSATLR